MTINKTVLLIDGNNLAFASFLAKAKLNEETNGLSNFIERLLFFIDKFNTNNVYILWDGDSWRKSVCPKYKQQRKSNEKLQEVISKIKENRETLSNLINSFGISQVSSSNMEADDLAFDFSKKLSNNFEVILISTDKDWYQLIDKNVYQYNFILNTIIDLQNFYKITGHRNTNNYIDAKCILGDKSDNIPGYKGIGPAYIEQIYSIYEDISSFIKDGKSLRADRWFVSLNKKIPKVIEELDYKDFLSFLIETKKIVALNSKIKPKIENLKIIKGNKDFNNFKDVCLNNGLQNLLVNKYILNYFGE